MLSCNGIKDFSRSRLSLKIWSKFHPFKTTSLNLRRFLLSSQSKMVRGLKLSKGLQITMLKLLSISWRRNSKNFLKWPHSKNIYISHVPLKTSIIYHMLWWCIMLCKMLFYQAWILCVKDWKKLQIYTPMFQWWVGHMDNQQHQRRLAKSLLTLRTDWENKSRISKGLKLSENLMELPETSTLIWQHTLNSIG